MSDPNTLIKAFSEKISKIKESDPKTLIYYYYYQRGYNYYELQKYEESIIDFTSVVENIKLSDQSCQLGPNIITAKWLLGGSYYQKGRVYYELKKDDEAVKNFSKAIEIDPSDQSALYNRGNAYFNLKMYQESISDLDKALNLDDGDVDARYIRGCSHYYLKNYQIAIKDLNETTKEDPEFVEAFNYLALSYFRIGHFPASIKYFGIVLQMDPNFDSVYYKRAKVYIKMKDFKRALDDLQKYLGKNPKKEQRVIYRMGFCYKQLGNLKQSNVEFKKVLALNPKFKDPYLGTGMEVLKGSTKKVKNLDIIQTIVDNAKQWLEEQKRTRRIQDKPIEKSMKEIANFNMKSIDVSVLCELLLNRGRVYVQHQRTDESILDFSLVLKLNSKSAKAYYQRGLSYYVNKNYKSALSDFTKSIQLDPTSLESYYSKGLAYNNLKMFKEARETFLSAMKLDDSFEGAYLGLGGINVNKAVQAYSKAIDKNLNSDIYYKSNIYRERGYCNKIMGNFELAISDFEECLKRDNSFEGELEHEIREIKKMLNIKVDDGKIVIDKEAIDKLQSDIEKQLAEKDRKIKEQYQTIRQLRNDMTRGSTKVNVQDAYITKLKGENENLKKNIEVMEQMDEALKKKDEIIQNLKNDLKLVADKVGSMIIKAKVIPFTPVYVNEEGIKKQEVTKIASSSSGRKTPVMVPKPGRRLPARKELPRPDGSSRRRRRPGKERK